MSDSTQFCRYPIGSDEHAAYIKGYEEVQRKMAASHLRYQLRLTWQCFKNCVLVTLIVHEIYLLVLQTAY